MTRTCPFCSSPARWVALLSQGGSTGKSTLNTIRKLLARFSLLSGDGCSSGGCKSGPRLRSATRLYTNHAELVRTRREAARALGLCTTCQRHRAAEGYAQCRHCQEARARKKRMARRIGTKRCPCGQPATNIWSGEYICPDCMRKET